MVDSNLILHMGNFIAENTGNIKDFYKITSCIGKGTFRRACLLENRGVRRSAQVHAQGNEGTEGSQDHQQEVLGGRGKAENAQRDINSQKDGTNCPRLNIP